MGRNISIISFFNQIRGDSLKARVRQSVVWTIGGLACSQFLRLASNLILARLLFPEAFGVMALVQVFIAGLAAVSDMGIRSAIIQSDRSHDPVFLNTAWTLQIARGFVLWLFSFLIALPVATLYGEPILASLLPVAGLTALILGFTPTRAATYNRDLNLGRLTLIEVIAQLIGMVSTICLALALQSVWALVFGSIASVLVNQVMLHTLLPGHHDQLQMDRFALKELISFGKWIFLSSAFGFLVNHADRAILGKFIPIEILGIYSVGILVAGLPMLIGQVLANRVLLPLYKQRPPWRNEENLRKISVVRWFFTSALFIISTPLIFFGDYIIGILFDIRYQLAGPILVLVAMSQLTGVILCSYDQILLAAGDSRRFMNRIFILSTIQTVLLVLGAIQFGLVGAVAARGISLILIYPYIIRAMRRYHSWHWRHDTVFSVTALVIGALGVWINQDAIAQIVTETLP